MGAPPDPPPHLRLLRLMRVGYDVHTARSMPYEELLVVEACMAHLDTCSAIERQMEQIGMKIAMAQSGETVKLYQRDYDRLQSELYAEHTFFHLRLPKSAPVLEVLAS